MTVVAKLMAALSAQMLTAGVPTVVPPAGLDAVSLAAAARLNARALDLVKQLDLGSWMLAGGAVEVANAAEAFMAKEAENAASFSGSSVVGGAATGLVPAFPAPPNIPDLTLPEVPAPPGGVIDAEYTSMLVNGGSGDALHDTAADMWKSTGRTLSEISEVLDGAREGLRSGWQAPEAEGAHAALKKFKSWVDDTGKAATALGNDWGAHAANFRKVKGKIPTPQEASETKQNLVQAMNENAANGGMSTPKVVQFATHYNEQNATTEVEMASYDGNESSTPALPGPGAPPPISAHGLPRVDGLPRPAPGPLKDRLTDEAALKGVEDPKEMMAAMMAAAAGAAGGLGALGQAGKGIMEPIQKIPQQIAQQIGKLGQMGQPTGLGPNKAMPTKKTGSKGLGKGGGKGGGTKPAGLGGGAKLGTPPPLAVPAAASGPAVVRPPAAGVDGAGMVGGMGGGMMPMGGMMAGAGQGGQKDKGRNKDLFPDDQEFDDDQEHAPAVLGARPEVVKKPTYDRKLGSAPIKDT